MVMDYVIVALPLSHRGTGRKREERRLSHHHITANENTDRSFVSPFIVLKLTI